MLKLEGKTAPITGGGGSGIGLAIAQRYAQEDAQVIIFGRRQAQLGAAVASIGARATAVQGDVTDADETTGAHIDKAFDLNVRGLVLTVHGA